MKVRDTAPDFSLETASGEKLNLSQFRGKNVVLYFYPRDETPGSTASRVTFIIGKEGKVGRVFPKVQVDGHSEEVPKLVRDLR